MKKDESLSTMTNVKYIVMFFFIFIFCIFSYYFVSKGLNNYKYITIDYTGSSSIDYKVYLKENNFFTEPYLEMDRTYIASLIDYIDVLFNYNLKYSKLVSGTYKYYVKGTILANKSGSDDANYWSKSYDLTKPELVEYSGQDNFNVTSNVQIDYQEYSNLLKKFRQEYGLSIVGTFRLELIIESVGKSDDMSKPVELNSNVELNIPLTEQAIELSIDSENDDDTGQVSEKIKLSGIKYTIYWGLGIIFGAGAMYFAGIIIYNAVMTYKKRSEYYKKLKKILATYDSIIVNVSNVPNLNNLEVINVHSFQELIDAHSEVRMPINYVEEEPGLKSIFMLVSNNMAWMYVLKHEDYSDKKRKNDKNFNNKK